MFILIFCSHDGSDTAPNPSISDALYARVGDSLHTLEALMLGLGEFSVQRVTQMK